MITDIQDFVHFRLILLLIIYVSICVCVCRYVLPKCWFLLLIIYVPRVSVCGLIIYVSCVPVRGYVHMSVGVSRGQKMGVRPLGSWVTGDYEPRDMNAGNLNWILCKNTLNNWAFPSTPNKPNLIPVLFLYLKFEMYNFMHISVWPACSYLVPEKVSRECWIA